MMPVNSMLMTVKGAIEMGMLQHFEANPPTDPGRPDEVRGGQRDAGLLHARAERHERDARSRWACRRSRICSNSLRR